MRGVRFFGLTPPIQQIAGAPKPFTAILEFGDGNYRHRKKDPRKTPAFFKKDTAD